MALKSGRVGVAPDQVDVYGKIKAAGSGSNMEIRVNEEGQPQWREKGTEDWQNFSSGGIGWNIPQNLLSSDYTVGPKVTEHSGGYYVDGTIVYIDIYVTTSAAITSAEDVILGLPPRTNINANQYVLCTKVSENNTPIIVDQFDNSTLQLVTHSTVQCIAAYNYGKVNGAGRYHIYGVYATTN